MPRKLGFFIPGVAVHVVQRGYSRNPVFFDTSDYQAYHDYLRDSARRHVCRIHAYVLMTNHVHLLVTPSSKDSVVRMMKATNTLYVPYINCTYGTSGSIWEGRYKASLINEDEYLLTCMRYIELNPVRAGMVHAPEEYCWSSYGCNAWGDVDESLTAHANYPALGESGKNRRSAYRALFNGHLDIGDINKIRRACKTGTPPGNDRFREMVEQKLQCRVGQDR